MRLQGKTVLITSGSSGIGLAMAHPFAAEGVVRSDGLFHSRTEWRYLPGRERVVEECRCPPDGRLPGPIAQDPDSSRRAPMATSSIDRTSDRVSSPSRRASWRGVLS
jgi:hypothetical protein